MDTSTDPGDITRLLEEWRLGDSDAAERLAPLVYPELRRLARFHLRGRERQSFSPTELVHEAYVRLAEGGRPSLPSRARFYAIAARTMRQVLTDWARAHMAEKRGGGAPLMSLDWDQSEGQEAASRTVKDLLAVDDALSALAAFDERKATVLEMKFFGGMTAEEIAEVLGIATVTVHREIRAATAWLRQSLAGEEE